MSLDHAKFAQSALRGIAKHGRQVTLIRRQSGPSARPWEGSGGADVERSVKALFASDSGLGLEVVSRTRRSIRHGEARSSVLIAAADPGFESDDEPELFSELKDGDDLWGISLSDTLAPGETTILHDFTLESRR